MFCSRIHFITTDFVMGDFGLATIVSTLGTGNGERREVLLCARLAKEIRVTFHCLCPKPMNRSISNPSISNLFYNFVQSIIIFHFTFKHFQLESVFSFLLNLKFIQYENCMCGGRNVCHSFLFAGTQKDIVLLFQVYCFVFQIAFSCVFLCVSLLFSLSFVFVYPGFFSLFMSSMNF